MFKKFFRKITGKKESVMKIRLVDQPDVDSLTFTLLLGFDVGMEGDSLNVHISNLAFMSNGQKSTKFIEESAEKAVRSTVAALCVAAGLHVQNHDNVGFKKSKIPALSPPPTKTSTNLN